MAQDTDSDHLEALARRAVSAAIRQYCTSRHQRVGAFTDRHFSLRGTLALHRAALGWDIIRAPVNLTMAAPAAVVHLTAAGARRLGAYRTAAALSRQRLLVPTSVARRIEWLICAELLELPCRIGDRVATRDALAETIAGDPHALRALHDRLLSCGIEVDAPLPRRRLEQALTEYGVSRGAAAEITTALLTLGTGAMTLGKLTPGAVSFGPLLASIMAQQAAISTFPLGAGLGSLWYGLFPATPSPMSLFGLSGGLLAAGSVLAAFAGVIADPVQRRLGLHQRRLHRMIDAMERQMLDPAAPDYSLRDRYVARLLDALDMVTSVYRLTR